ncbi:MAG: adenosylcobinamide-GDP ribazoletransferase [Syntrophobacterales bacterium]|nr:adenosylcobinamide-GDP ribazoletransferase [Syntrophobacterales bacterium]
MKEFLVALQFLTRIPVKIKGNLSEKEIGQSAVFFPAVGVLQGLSAVCAAFFFSLMFSADIASGLVIIILLITNWGFHIDGLADTADAVSVKTTGDPMRDTEQRLSVMKDSTIGAIGVVAIISVLLLKYLFVSGLLQKGLTWDVLYVLFLMPVFSKWIMVPIIYHGRSVRDTGLGNIFIRHVNSAVLVESTLLLAVIYFITSCSLPEVTWRNITMLFFLFSVSLYILGLLWVAFCKKKFGGLTGDTIGAVSELAEVLLPAIGFLWL